MRKIYLFCIILLISGQAAAQDWRWINKISTNLDLVPAVKIDAAENIFVMGSSWGVKPTVFKDTRSTGRTFKPGNFLAKYSRTGEIQWIRSLDSIGGQSSFQFTLDDKGYILLAHSDSGRIGILKLDTDGNLVWKAVQRIARAKSAYASALTTDRDGNVIIGGSFAITDYPRSENPNDFFIMKYSETGQLTWIRQHASGSRYICVGNIQADENGSLYLTGNGSDLCFSGERDSIKLSGGNYLALYTAAGEPVWAKIICNNCDGLATVVDHSMLYLTGRFNDSTDIGQFRLTSSIYGGFIARLSRQGDVHWAKSIDAYGAIINTSLVNPSNGLLYISGGFSRHLHAVVNNVPRDFYSADYYGYNLDFFIMGLDSLGTARYVNVVEILEGQMWGNIDISQAGNIAASGLYWGNGVYSSPGKKDTITGRKDNVSYDMVVCYLSGCTATATIGSMDPVCIGSQPFTLQTGSPAGGTYSGAGVVNGVFYPRQAGRGKHWITYSYPCSGAADSTQIEVYECTGIADAQAPRFQLYPNPAGSTLKIISGLPSYTLEISDLLGKIILQKQSQAYEYELDLSGYAPGVYVVKLRAAGAELVQKLVKR